VLAETEAFQKRKKTFDICNFQSLKKKNSRNRVSNSDQGAGPEFETRVWLCVQKLEAI
jgi:hypothetical protein